MPFTNLDRVRQHLSEVGVGQDNFRDVPIQLSGMAPAFVGHARIKSGSLVVKSKELGKPQFESIAFSDDSVSLAKQGVIPDSVVVASDTSLGTIYTENVDFTVDCEEGKVTRVGEGGIASDAQVAVWYYYYTVHEEGEDYSANYTKGTVHRVAGSGIEDGQVAFIDYQTEIGVFVDQQIAQAIAEADDRVLRKIASEHHNSTQQALITAETYLAVAILCRMKAVGALTPSQASGAINHATDWLELANRYESDGLRMLVPFLPARSKLMPPKGVKSGGTS